MSVGQPIDASRLYPRQGLGLSLCTRLAISTEGIAALQATGVGVAPFKIVGAYLLRHWQDASGTREFQPLVR
jgi:hypothetical protein